MVSSGCHGSRSPHGKSSVGNLHGKPHFSPRISHGPPRQVGVFTHTPIPCQWGPWGNTSFAGATSHGTVGNRHGHRGTVGDYQYAGHPSLLCGNFSRTQQPRLYGTATIVFITTSQPHPSDSPSASTPQIRPDLTGHRRHTLIRARQTARGTFRRPDQRSDLSPDVTNAIARHRIAQNFFPRRHQVRSFLTASRITCSHST